MNGIAQALNECQKCGGQPKMTAVVEDLIHIECLHCGKTVEERGAWIAIRIWNGY